MLDKRGFGAWQLFPPVVGYLSKGQITPHYVLDFFIEKQQRYAEKDF
jgi:hypothetical protein